MANKHVKKCSSLLAVRGMQIETTVRYYFTPTGMVIIKDVDNHSVDKDMKKLEPSYPVSGKVK